MTPLAQKIMRELTEPRSSRWEGRGWKSPSGTKSLLDAFAEGEIHCFEVTDVLHAMEAVRNSSLKSGRWGPSDELHFLPAPRTWIEWRELEHPKHPGLRHGYLLQTLDVDEDFGGFTAKDSVLTAIGAIELPPGSSRRWSESPLRMIWDARGPRFNGSSVGAYDDTGGAATAELESQVHVLIPILCAYLALINTPRIIGRRIHMPHAGLQRRLAAAHGMVGKFPLRAWTEIKLEVRPPVFDESDPQDAYLTGARALHFCRAHLRIRYGKLEYVSAHWRGDAAIGIKQSRYKLVEPRRISA